VFLWYTETVFSWYIQSFVPKCAYFISLSNGNKLRSFTIPKRQWYLWGQVRVITIFTVFRLLTDFVCLYTYEFWLSFCKIVRSSAILLLPLFSNIIMVFLYLHYICEQLQMGDFQKNEDFVWHRGWNFKLDKLT
jgi:hypothetical protein